MYLAASCLRCGNMRSFIAVHGLWMWHVDLVALKCVKVLDEG